MSLRTFATVVAIGLGATGLVAACGSQVPPDAFYRAQASGAAGAAPPGPSPTGVVASEGGSSAARGHTPSAAVSSSASSGPAAGGGTGGSGGFGARPSTSAAPSASHTSGSRSTSAPASSTSAPAQSACTPPTASTPTVVVCPHTGLHDGQTVHVYGSGFQNAKPSGFIKALVVTECADKGNDTQQADCGALHFLNPDGDGRVSLTMTVTKVVGSNKNVCGAKYQCLISVAQPKQPPDYEADQHISFV